ncbi:MAG: 50S ribosomal protein L24 [Candidatus Pacearchaeota archaeon]
MPACSFCKKQYENPRGLTIFKNDGTNTYFCSSKCRRNSALKRDPKKVKWIKKAGKISPGISESSEKKEIIQEDSEE